MVNIELSQYKESLDQLFALSKYIPEGGSGEHALHCMSRYCTKGYILKDCRKQVASL